MKFTIDTIKDLKIKVKEMNVTLLSYYTQTEFKPDDSFRLFTEQSEISETNKNLVGEMISAFEKNETEFEAGKLLFENLKLNPKQASDIGFWTYHNHYTFYQYITKRWGDVWNNEIEVVNPSTYIVNHWIQSNSSQGELIDYPISGLWWSFYLTVDKEREDKYELTKIFFKNLTIRTKLLGAARFARHKPAIIGILEFIKENNLDSKSMEQAGRAIVPYINLLGGIRPLSYFDKDWFKTKLKKRFGEQIKAGQKLFIRPDEIKITKQNNATNNISETLKQPEIFDRYLCLNAESGNYMISSKADDNWDYCIGLNFEIQDQFLIHFYQEGKIKKTKVNGSLSNKTIDRSKPYSNGKSPKLTLIGFQLINQPVLFGIAYKTRYGVFFKAMDEQSLENFRTDNSELNQEGKKVLYLDEPFKSAYKILPYEIKDALGTLVMQSPTSKGADITNKYHADKWKVLKNYWAELFNGSVGWS
jgi:hypothetical protein